MNDIKLRAWDRREKRMIYIEQFSQIPSNWRDVWDLMLWTGLRDREGREIYEGDLVTMYGGKMLHEVIFECGSFLLIYPGNRRKQITTYPEDVEIIGNLHEHPDLLK